jgi:hypothetical protein
MGMPNEGLNITEINSGELSELAFTIACVVKLKWGKSKPLSMFHQQVGRDVVMQLNDDHFPQYSVNYFDITIEGDGKMVLPLEQMKIYFDGNATPKAKNIIEKTFRFVETYDLPEFDTIKCKGGASDKDDVALFLHGLRVEGFSLKWEHENVERSQSPKWSALQKFYGRFLDIKCLEEWYQDQYEIFTEPQWRYSDKKGDYSPALREATRIMFRSVEFIEEYFAEALVERDFNARQFAQGIIKTYLGDQESIVFVELSKGTHKRISLADIRPLTKKITEGEFSYTQESTDSGKTNRTIIYLNNKELMKFQTTASTDKAANSVNPEKERNLRRVKRQTYLGITL